MKTYLFAALAGTAIASVAQAQYAFPVFNPAPSATTSTWRNTNLGAAPAGSYTTFMVMLDWTSVGAGNGWSNEARSTLSSMPANANTLSTPTYPVGNVLYRNNLAAATGSAGTTANVNNIYWTGTLATSYAGGSDMYLNFRQSFGAANPNWSNVRVVLNPIVNAVTNYATAITAPSTFTDLGTLAVGNTNQSHAVAPGAGAWFRFQVSSNVNNAQNNAFDFFTSGAEDTRLHIFRQTPGGLLPIASNDDIAGATNRNGGASFGSSDPNAYGRDTWNTTVAGGAAWFNGRGGDTVSANVPSLTNTAGSGALNAGDVYWAWSGYWSGSGLATTSQTSLQMPNAVTFNTVATHTVNFTSTPLTTIPFALEIRSVPTPGSAMLLGMGGLVALRRRR